MLIYYISCHLVVEKKVKVTAVNGNNTYFMPGNMLFLETIDLSHHGYNAQ
jgi:archaellum component FlaG (FlaF/FlaG flagellin family)